MRYEVAAAIVVLLFISIAGIQYSLNNAQRQSTSSTTTLSTTSETSQVDVEISQLVIGMQQLGGSRNLSAVLQFYTNSSRMTSIGNITSDGGAPFNTKGSYVGIVPIKTVYSDGFGNFIPTPTITVSNLSTKFVGPFTVNASFNLFVNGKTAFWGGANATVSVQQQWIGGDGEWVISNETWDYLTTWTQMPGFGGL